MKRFPLPTVVTALVLVLILSAYAVTFQVRFSQAAVKVSIWQKDNAVVVTEPGLYFKWPPPVEKVHAYDMRLRTLETPETEIKTSDGQNVIVGCYALWKIEDPLQFFIRIGNERDADERLRTRINEVRATVIGRHNLGEFVNLDRTLVDRTYQQLQQEMIDLAGTDLSTSYGVQLVQVGIRRISLPEEATQSVLESMKQEREKLAAKYREEGKGLAAAIRARAESLKDQILAFADSKAKEIEAEGTRATERILAQVSDEDSEFFIWLRYLDALRASFKSDGTLVLDAQSVLFAPFASPSVSAPAPRGAPTAEAQPTSAPAAAEREPAAVVEIP